MEHHGRGQLVLKDAGGYERNEWSPAITEPDISSGPDSCWGAHTSAGRLHIKGRPVTKAGIQIANPSG